MAYDAQGDLISQQYPKLLMTQYAYDVRHGLLDLNDPAETLQVRVEDDEFGRKE